MNIKASLKKEALDGLRNYRFIIILAGFLFFAIFTPVMTKYVLPGLFSVQFPELSDDAISGMISMTQIDGLRTFFGDIFQMGTLMMVFVLSGILAQELNEKTLILPITAGKKFGELLASKMLIYGSALVASSVLTSMVSYLYTGMLFGFDMPSLLPVIRSGLLLGLYLVFVLSMLIVIGSFIKKPTITGLVTLIPAWFLPQLGSLFKINRFLPSGLMDEVQAMAVTPSSTLLLTIVCTFLIILLLIGLTMTRLTKIELTKG